MKLFRQLVCGFALVGIITTSMGCTQAPNAVGTNPKVIRIGITLYRSDDTFISVLNATMNRYAKELEQRDNIKIVVDTVDAAGQQSKQNNQVDTFISQKYDVICVNMVDRTVAAVTVDKAKAAGIPVVFFNREPVGEDIARWDKVYYVGAHAEEAGRIMGELFAEAYWDNTMMDTNGDGKIQYVRLEGELGHQDSLLRTEYSLKTISARGIMLEKLEADTANWQRAPAKDKMTSWINTHGNKIEAVFGNNDDMALGAIDAMEEAGLFVPVFGVDATNLSLQAIKEGRMYGTVFNDYEGQAKAIIEIAYQMATTGTVKEIENMEGQYVWTPYSGVTDTNIKELLKER